jgi:hypothetical protein
VNFDSYIVFSQNIFFKGLSMRAERRGRSKADDFYELVEVLNRKKLDKTLEFFNTVFGSGEKSRTFWEGYKFKNQFFFY